MDTSLSLMQRLEVLNEVVQELTYRKYKPATYENTPVFKLGDEVLASWGGFEYISTIVEVNEATCPDYHKKMPCYQITFNGWKSTPRECEWVMEYDMVGLHDNFHPVQHLLAHYYNEELLKTHHLTEAKLCGFFRLSTADIENLENKVFRDMLKVVPGTDDWTIRNWLEKELPTL